MKSKQNLGKVSVYNSCKILPLRIFFEITNIGNVELLIIDNATVAKKILVETWESIIEEYAKLDGNQQVQDVMEKGDELYRQAALYCEIKGMLLYLVGAYKQEYIERLSELGYNVDDSSMISRRKSIQQCDRRANNISTRMQIIQKEIESYSEDGKKGTFDDAMSFLGLNLPHMPDENITVSRFLSYKKQINERNKAARTSNRPSGQLA